jgi:beta-lactamase class A
VISGPLFLASVSLMMSTPTTAVRPPPVDVAQPAPDWPTAVASAARYAQRRDGSVSFALVDDSGRLYGYDAARSYDSASVVKAMLLVAYLIRQTVRNRPLGASDRALLDPMIQRSDNAAASRVYSLVGAAGLDDVAARAGMVYFATRPSWGSTQIAAADQARFLARMPDLVPERHRAYALDVLAHVTGSQRWGIPEAVPRDARVFFKGGWRPEEDGWIVHQVALVERDGRRVALAVLTNRAGSEAYGEETIRGVARRAMRPLLAP